MRHSTVALLAVGMFVFAGTSDLRAQDEAADADVDATAEVTADATAEITADASEDTPTDVRVVDATYLSPGSFEPMALSVEFSGTGDELAAAITVPDMGLHLDLLDLLLTEDKFSFSVVTPEGQAIECNLYKLDDDSFRGECIDDGGESAEMTIGAFEE